MNGYIDSFGQCGNRHYNDIVLLGQFIDGLFDRRRHYDKSELKIEYKHRPKHARCVHYDLSIYLYVDTHQVRYMLSSL